MCKSGQTPGKSADEVEFTTAEWVAGFNHRRTYEYCGDMAPVERERVHYADHTRPVEELEPSHYRIPGLTGGFTGW